MKTTKHDSRAISAMPISERLEARTIPIPEAGCHLWLGQITRTGYGQMRINGRAFSVHRLAWEQRYGVIPDGLCVLHRCDVRCCVNPAHLFLGTLTDNVRDCLAKARYRNGRTKLSPADVAEIRQRRASGELLAEIAKDYSVDWTHVRRVANHTAWRSLK